MLNDNVLPFTIPNNGSTTEARDITNQMIGALLMPSVFTAANLLILGSMTHDGTYVPVYRDDGTKAVIVAGSARLIGIIDNALAIASLKFIKFQSVSTADNLTEVNQVGNAGVRTYPITTNAVAGDTVIIGGVTFTASADTQDSTHFIVGADATATGANLATALNANATISALYTAVAATGTITLTEKISGGLNTPSAATTTGTIVIGTGTVTASVSGARILNFSVKR